MALRTPLVLVSGQIQQLQSGDTLNAPQSGGDVVALTNDESSPVVLCSAVYMDAADGFKKARANASGTKDVVGLVATSPSITNAVSGSIMVAGILTAATSYWDAVAGTSGGLTFNTKYYLDPNTAGLITSTPPSAVGQYVVPIGVAISTTEMMISIHPSILL